MALPHYNLNATEETLEIQQSAFPVILVPEDAPPKSTRIRNFFRSKILLSIFGIIALAACGAALWSILDPNSRAPHLKDFQIHGIVLGACALYFLLAALLGKTKEAVIPSLIDDPIPLVTKVKEIPSPQTNTHIEVFFEQWSSEPFDEILDEALLAEVFNDEMLAPDHMVFSLRLED